VSGVKEFYWVTSCFFNFLIINIVASTIMNITKDAPTLGLLPGHSIFLSPSIVNNLSLSTMWYLPFMQSLRDILTLYSSELKATFIILFLEQ